MLVGVLDGDVEGEASDLQLVLGRDAERDVVEGSVVDGSPVQLERGVEIASQEYGTILSREEREVAAAGGEGAVEESVEILLGRSVLEVRCGDVVDGLLETAVHLKKEFPSGKQNDVSSHDFLAVWVF